LPHLSKCYSNPHNIPPILAILLSAVKEMTGTIRIQRCIEVWRRITTHYIVKTMKGRKPRSGREIWHKGRKWGDANRLVCWGSRSNAPNLVAGTTVRSFHRWCAFSRLDEHFVRNVFTEHNTPRRARHVLRIKSIPKLSELQLTNKFQLALSCLNVSIQRLRTTEQILMKFYTWNLFKLVTTFQFWLNSEKK
jgi:hypothetical protein